MRSDSVNSNVPNTFSTESHEEPPVSVDDMKSYWKDAVYNKMVRKVNWITRFKYNNICLHPSGNVFSEWNTIHYGNVCGIKAKGAVRKEQVVSYCAITIHKDIHGNVKRVEDYRLWNLFKKQLLMLNQNNKNNISFPNSIWIPKIFMKKLKQSNQINIINLIKLNYMQKTINLSEKNKLCGSFCIKDAQMQSLDDVQNDDNELYINHMDMDNCN